MFITVTAYRARAGEEDAIVALHEDWDRRRRPDTRGFVSGELLQRITDPRAFTDIARFESEEAARAHAEEPERVTWFRRLVSLTESEPELVSYRLEWSSNDWERVPVFTGGEGLRE
jgi:quinol monooxygenase YgiN